MADLDLLLGHEKAASRSSRQGLRKPPHLQQPHLQHLQQQIRLITLGGHGLPRRRHGLSRRATGRGPCRRRSRLATASPGRLFVSGAVGRALVVSPARAGQQLPETGMAGLGQMM